MSNLSEKKEIVRQELEKLTKVEADLKSESETLRGITPRRENLLEEIRALNDEIEQHRGEVGRAMKAIAHGDMKEEQLDVLRSTGESLQNKLVDRQKLLEVLSKVEKETAEKFRLLEKQRDGLTHSFWFAVSMLEKEKILGDQKSLKALAPFWRAWAAQLLGGVPVSLGDFILHNFRGQFGFEDLEKVKADLVKEYRG